MGRISADIVNALLEPVPSALRAWIGVDRSPAKVDLVSELPPPPGIMVTIELKGGLVGTITWNFEQPVARQIALTMLPGAISDDEICPGACADAVAELANIIAGNASGVLAAAGYPVEIMPPQTWVRDQASPLSEKTLSFTFATPLGRMTMLICVQPGPAVRGAQPFRAR